MRPVRPPDEAKPVECPGPRLINTDSFMKLLNEDPDINLEHALQYSCRTRRWFRKVQIVVICLSEASTAGTAMPTECTQRIKKQLTKILRLPTRREDVDARDKQASWWIKCHVRNTGPFGTRGPWKVRSDSDVQKNHLCVIRASQLQQYRSLTVVFRYPGGSRQRSGKRLRQRQA